MLIVNTQELCKQRNIYGCCMHDEKCVNSGSAAMRHCRFPDIHNGFHNSARTSGLVLAIGRTKIIS